MAAMSQGPDGKEEEDAKEKPASLDDAWGDLLGDGPAAPSTVAPVAPPLVAPAAPASLFAPPALDIPDVAAPVAPAPILPPDPAPPLSVPEIAPPIATPEIAAPLAAPIVPDIAAKSIPIEDQAGESTAKEPATDEQPEATQAEPEPATPEPESVAANRDEPEPEADLERAKKDEANVKLDEARTEKSEPNVAPVEKVAVAAAARSDADTSVRKAVAAHAELSDLDGTPDRSGAFEVGADVLTKKDGDTTLPYWILGVAAAGVIAFMAWQSGGGGHHGDHEGPIESRTGVPTVKEAPEKHGATEHREPTKAPPHAEKTDELEKAAEPEKAPPEEGQTDGAAGEDAAAADQEAGAEAGAEPAPEPSEAPPESGDGSDVRAVPPGTKSANAKAFKKVPVAPGDRPPVGGVGETGIHVDALSLGSEYVDRACTGKKDDFSASAGDVVTACLRLVHQREAEEVMAIWRREGKTVRRSKIAVKPIHAYATRVYLNLRADLVGEWTLVVESSDGAELATARFRVVD
jgi:hypothetical protein